jgi:enoyl-CoA hydratase
MARGAPGQPNYIVTEDHGVGVRIVRLNREERLNAVCLPLYHQLEVALGEIAESPVIRALVITGTGRGFCVGADLKAHGTGELSPEERDTYVRTGQRVFRQLQTIPQPTIAAVNGHAIGAGLELALSCDFIVVAEEAKLRLPEIGLGTFVGGGTVYTLSQRVGVARAKELIMLGDFFTGRDAASMGLANRAVPADQVRASSLELAATLASKAPISMRLAKDLLARAQRMDFETAMDLEGSALLECMASRDWKEGIDAFHAKRDPEFKGR